MNGLLPDMNQKIWGEGGFLLNSGSASILVRPSLWTDDQRLDGYQPPY
jgi:hypothetical protein